MKGRILIVDDEEAMRESLLEILQLEGYKVDAKPDGAKGVQAITENNYDLLLLDMKMKGMSGLEVLEQVVEISPECRVIMLTAHGSLESAIEALRLGAHDYILKPATPEQILSSVAKGISERRDTDRKKHLITQMEASLQELKDAEGLEEEIEVSRSVFTMENDVRIDLERREIWLPGSEKVQLTPTEGKLMQILLENKGRVLSHKELVFLVQGYQTTDWEAPEIMRPLVSRLRRKLTQFDGGEDWIVNVRGTGYVFDGR